MTDQREPKRLPTSHDFAWRLLALPDLPLITQNDCVEFRLVSLDVDDKASWSDPDRWVDDQPAVTLYDHTGSLPAMPPCDGWQPIETAPRDGTLIDLWCNGERRPDCFWGEEWEEPEERGWRQKYAETSRAASFSLLGGEPTHWMPLPEPPNAE